MNKRLRLKRSESEEKAVIRLTRSEDEAVNSTFDSKSG